MAFSPSLTAAAIGELLDDWLETEFTFYRVESLATTLARYPRDAQDFVLDWTRRIATTHREVAYRFAQRAGELLGRMDTRLMEAWVLHTMDVYDRSGLYPALRAIDEVENFAQLRHEHTAGALFEEVDGVLAGFAHGLAGRYLKLARGDGAYTDGETLYLPPVVATLATAADNFQLCKALVAYMWAQTRFGAFRGELLVGLANASHPQALEVLSALESLRLEACLERELPGLHREMVRLQRLFTPHSLTGPWEEYRIHLADPARGLVDSLGLLTDACGAGTPPAFCYQAQLRPALVAERLVARLEREKMLLRVRLAELAADARPKEKPTSPSQDPQLPRFQLEQAEETPDGLPHYELVLNDTPVTPPDDVNQLLTSIVLDLGEIPEEYLVAAGPGEYDPRLYQEQPPDPDAVWQGTYHEEGASLYPEWDFRRRHYRKDWCVMREKDVPPVHDDFVATTLDRYSGVVKHLRRSFEALRDENRRLRRQSQGDEVDIDALVEALMDARQGTEMTDRLFIRTHRTERNIATVFMVDMSGSTKGWINDAEREALVLLCQALESLGDRYAIYGFSGITRKRCELYRIKRLDEPYNAEVRARISGIRPQEYTRMGFAIRHLTQLLQPVEARTKLLITLSDGKPDDYHDGYRGEYGIEDTRQALIEAQRSGIHPFCITIDEQARDYLPHLYGPAHYVIVDDLRKLPLKVTDIYRRLTR